MKSFKIKAFITTAFLLGFAAIYITQPDFNVKAVHASHSDFDLANLRETNPELVLAYDKISIQQGWEFVKKAAPILSEVIVGVVDTDAQTNHPEFGNVSIGQTPLSTEVVRVPHGTAVMGIIGANNISASRTYEFPHMNGIISGVTSNYILGFRNIGAGDKDDFAITMNDLIAGGSKLLNLSLGLVLESALTEEQKTIFADKAISQAEFDEYSKFFNEYFSQRTDVLFVVSAGNQTVGVRNHVPGGNTAFTNTIATGATKLDDSRLTVHSPSTNNVIAGSNFGSPVALAAPGEQVYAPAGFIAPLGLDDYWNPLGRSDKESDRFFGGTSAAAPMVTGVAAILRSIMGSIRPDPKSAYENLRMI